MECELNYPKTIYVYLYVMEFIFAFMVIKAPISSKAYYNHFQQLSIVFL